MRRLIVLCWSIACIRCCTATCADDLNDAFRALAEEAWEYRLRESPLFATSTGDNRFNDRLPQVTLEDHARRHAKRQDLLRRARELDPDKLSATTRAGLQIFTRLMQDQLTENEFQTHLMPITNRWGFHIEFPELPNQVPLESVSDYDNYIKRLKAFTTYTDQHIQLMREGIKQGMILPAMAMQEYRNPITTHIVQDSTTSLMFKPFLSLPDTFSSEEATRLRTLATEAIEQSIVPSYERFLAFMEQEYIPATRDTVGASALPRGREFYRHRVRKFTTLNVLPQEIHALGLREVKRIRLEMDEIIQTLDFEGDFHAFVQFLRTDDQFYASSADQLMREVAYILKKMDGQLPKLFGHLPRAPYGIRRVPDYIAPATTTAYYMRGSGDGKRAGFYYVNTFNLKSRPLYGLEALSLHEAVPGHHLQLALQQELPNVLDFRRHSGFTAFVEGWALYAERLGLEVGFYEDPYSNFGRLSYEIWRACRLVVDTGIHYMSWTRPQAIEYMRKNSAMSDHNIRSEVDRYIAWPGQALAYKVGELKIRELRDLAENQLQDRFDLRGFHDAVLSGGSVPLDVLETQVQLWISEVERTPESNE